MSLKIAICLLLVLFQIYIINSETDSQDVAALTSLGALWTNLPPSWNGFVDPCGNHWEGVVCTGSRVTSVSLSSLGLIGTLSGDIQGLSELQILDLSYNKGLTGPLPPAIGTLSKLTSLILIGCNFNGGLPTTLGSLTQLIFLSLNSNSFSGEIPNSIGNLSNLYWLDLADNELTGTLPVSNGTTPGLDMLFHTKHFHFGNNKLSGPILPQLFNENMTLIHLLLDNNQLSGSIPSTLGLVKKLEIVRLDWNSLSGPVPSNISNLTTLTDLIISNNGMTGSLPDLTGMNLLNYLDLSNNTYDASDFPSWIASLNTLTTVVMENTKITGSIPVELFGLPQLQTVNLKKNRLSGTVSLGVSRSSQLQLVDLQYNNISSNSVTARDSGVQLILVGNPICAESVTTYSYCINPEHSDPTYTTPQNCAPVVCNPNEVSSPSCKCAFPYSGSLVFRAPKFSNLQNFTYYGALEQKLMKTFQTSQVPVDSVSVGNISRDPTNYLHMDLDIFPLGQDRFNRTAVLTIGFILSNQTFKPPPSYGPFYFIADGYTNFADELKPPPKKKFGIVAIIGITVGGAAFLLIIVLSVVAIICCGRKKPQRSVKPASPTGAVHGSPSLFGAYSSSLPQSAGPSSGNIPFTGSKLFSLDEVKKLTNNFSEVNVIGTGAFGKVFRGTLTNGQLVAIKKAEQGSAQGDLEFKTEIELLSRVHHKNLVSLLGFCVEKGELILVYEYVPNGTLKESLSGKSGIRLDWRRRIKAALGVGRGLAYMHELTYPPIIHRDVKSSNVLLDENLNAKVSDFGLCKPLLDPGKDHITTEVKGTMGYMDPEYYMTRKLNEKSDVYSFGVLMLELITGRSPIERGRYVVREVKNSMDKSQDLYGLHELLDPSIGLGTALKGFEKYVDLALCCVEELGADRPMMGEVVKHLEEIMEMAGLNPYSDSSGGSAMFDLRGSRSRPLYDDSSLYSHSGALPR